MKLFFVTTHFFPDHHFGGVVHASQYFYDSLAKLIPDITGFCVSQRPEAVISNSQHNIRCIRSIFFHRWGFAPNLKRELEPLINAADIVMVNGVMSYPTTIAANLCRKLKKPYIVAAHGGLMPYKLKEKRRRQFMFDHVIMPILDNATVVQAICENEHQCLIDLGLKTPVTVIPNGIDIADNTVANPTLPDHIEKKLQNKRLVLFMGRLTPIKGLDELLPAWAKVTAREQFKNCMLAIAGPDENGYLKTVRNLISKHRLHENVIITGLVTGKTKTTLIDRSDFYVLSSYSEGFSMAVLENLAAAKPVIITEGCNFPEIVQAGAGLCVQSKREQIENAICEFLSMPSAELAQIGQKGKQLLLENYTWDISARKFISVMDHILKNEKIPSIPKLAAI